MSVIAFWTAGSCEQKRGMRLIINNETASYEVSFAAPALTLTLTAAQSKLYVDRLGIILSPLFHRR